jgi:hypothetical protein
VNSWKRFKFRIRGCLIDGLNSLMNLLVDQSPEPNPDAGKLVLAHEMALNR